MSQVQQAAQSAPMQAQPQASNPLDQLRDIHLPEQIDQFPAAIGWWILLALIIAGLSFYLYRVYRYRKAIRLLKPAKTEIDTLRSLPQEKINAHAIATLSALLKRICLIYFPQKKTASLNGKAWLEFLNEQSNSEPAFFSQDNIRFFSQAAYQENPKINNSDWHQLLDSSQKCIKSIIKSAAKSKKNKKAIEQ